MKIIHMIFKLNVAFSWAAALLPVALAKHTPRQSVNSFDFFSYYFKLIINHLHVKQVNEMMRECVFK